jgi:hypothetical protein
MKHFTVIMKVTNCGNCPYSDTDGNENSICTMSEGDSVTSRKIRNENWEKITDSCPCFNELED